jgi:hypothetical protein
MAFVRRLLVACACTALAACATKPDPGPAYPWPDRDGSRPAPIVIRTGAIKRFEMQDSSALGAAVALGAHESLMSVAYSFLLPGFFLVGIPLAIADAHNAYTKTKIDPCPPRMTQALADVPNWVESTFRGVPTLQIVTDAARVEVGAAGPVIVALESASSPERRSLDIDQLGRQLHAETLIVADVQVVVGEIAAGNCSVKLAAIADVRVQASGKPEMKIPRYSVWAAQDDVPIEDWATHPEKAQQELRGLLRKLAGELIASYRERMGCSEQPCNW